jgi:hypothetical protein
MLVFVLALAFVGMMASGSAEAAQKSLGSGKVSFRAGGPTVSGYSISWITLLKYWKTGFRYWYD